MTSRAITILASLTVLFSVQISNAAEKLNWSFSPLLAGKANLAENGFALQRNLGSINVAPEMRLPLQLVYRSVDEGKFGIFGSNWSCPQLESRIFPRQGGVEWIAPWGEHIGFYEKDKTPSKDTPELFKDKSKGAGLFTPYADWEARIENGSGSVIGRFKNEGWKFDYVASRLTEISSPNGRKLSFAYSAGHLTGVSSNGVEFVALTWSKDANAVSSMTVNGVPCSFSYVKAEVPVLPDSVDGKMAAAKKVFLSSVAIGSLAPESFKYDECGFMASSVRGDSSETFSVEHVGESEQLAFLKKIADAKAAKRPTLNIIPEKVAGRILADKLYTYAYPAKDTVALTDKEGKTATFNYSSLNGALKSVDFAGLKTETYFFRRYDVAYNGKLRQVLDSKDRAVVTCRYDKESGEPVMVRDMADNEIRYKYDNKRNLVEVSRTGDMSPSDPLVPMAAFKYDGDNLVGVQSLDKDGKCVSETKLNYTASSDISSVWTSESKFDFTYNASGMPVRIADVFGNITAISYDKFNRVVSATAPNGVKTVRSYDVNGFVVEVKTAGEGLETSARLSYDALGRLVSVTDQDGKVKANTYDADGQVKSETMPDKTVVSYERDTLGRLEKVIDQNGNPIKFSWNQFGKLDERITAAGQIEMRSYDASGLLTSITNAFTENTVDSAREIGMAYDGFDRVARVSFGKDQQKTFKRDNWGKVIGVTAIDKAEKSSQTQTVTYDSFGRATKKVETDAKGKATTFEYSYTGSGKLAQTKVTFADGKSRVTTNSYDRYGRLSLTDDGMHRVQYEYGKDGKLAKQKVDSLVDINFEYDKLGRLSAKYMGDVKNPIASLKYSYSKNGELASRNVNGKQENFQYDAKGQLTAVLDATGKALEQYVYDPAGNILSKTIDGKTSKFTYDAANQLVCETMADGTVKNFAYDGASRMVSESTAQSTKSYAYGWLDKVMNVSSNAGDAINFTYSVSGQVSERKSGNDVEHFTWQGLALIRRGDINYTTERHVNGGNALAADGKVLFNDMLGNSLGTLKDGNFTANERTAFGEAKGNIDESIDFFTGKPQIDGLGYNFLYRNYRADLGKWTSRDPKGYPDGWNNFAYVNNLVVSCIDKFGTDIYHVVASGAVSGAGHSAVIIGNANTGYSFYSYGSGASSSGESGTGYDSYEEAFEALQDTRDDGENQKPQYDKVQKWDTSSEQDTSAQHYADNHIDDTYIPLVYDCLTFVYDVLEEASHAYPGPNVDYDRSAQTPNGAFENNKAHATTIME